MKLGDHYVSRWVNRRVRWPRETLERAAPLLELSVEELEDFQRAAEVEERKEAQAFDWDAWFTELRRKMLEPAAPDVAVLVIGEIAAGRPIEALPVPDGPIRVPAEMGRYKGAYALRVRGNSMRDDAIVDGDLVVIEPTEKVEQGQVAVVLLEDNKATLKRVYRERGRVRLQPANHEMEPIYVKEPRIQGRVRGVIREM